MTYRPMLRRPRRAWYTRLIARRNPLARAFMDGSGLFRERVKPNAKTYRRHAKHRLRTLAEVLA